MRPTASQKRRFARIVELIGCLACGSPYNIHIHHCRHNCGAGQRRHSEVAPLCNLCHKDGPISRHGQGSKEFQEKYPDKFLHEETCRRLGEL